MIDELDKNGVDAEAMDMLKLRLQMAKSSVKKYQAAERCVCSDGRARGLFQFYGASRTGRYSGRNIQLQNLPQNHMGDLAEARLGDLADSLRRIYEYHTNENGPPSEGRESKEIQIIPSCARCANGCGALSIVFHQQEKEPASASTVHAVSSGRRSRHGWNQHRTSW